MCRDDDLTSIDVAQVKQKSSEFRMYARHDNDRVTDRIRQAEAEAVLSCECCGET